jgi:hypothetical protein
MVMTEDDDKGAKLDWTQWHMPVITALYVIMVRRIVIYGWPG